MNSQPKSGIEKHWEEIDNIRRIEQARRDAEAFNDLMEAARLIKARIGEDLKILESMGYRLVAPGQHLEISQIRAQQNALAGTFGGSGLYSAGWLINKILGDFQ